MTLHPVMVRLHAFRVTEALERKRGNKMSIWKKKKAAPVNTAPVDDSAVGTMADVEEVMKKYDRESNVRIWEGKPKWAITALMAAFSVYCICIT